MAQTSYNVAPDVAFPGMPSDNGINGYVSVTNEETVGLMAGIMVKQGTTSDDALKLTATSDQLMGIVMHRHDSDPDLAASLVVAADEVSPVLRKGRSWVRCEEAIAIGDPVYVRHVATGGEDAGEFRNDPDGTAQVATITPTAVNDTDYALSVLVHDPQADRDRLFSFEYTSDGSATATEICDDLRTSMTADTAFAALVLHTGTATLILTSVRADVEFDVSDIGVGVLTSAATTAAAPDCTLLKNARFATPSATYNSVILAELDLNLD